MGLLGRRSQRAAESHHAENSELIALRRALDEVRLRLADTEESLRAIRHGEVDALMVGDAGPDRVFTLSSVDRPYRNFVENMSDGAATVSAHGIVLFANQALSDLVGWSCQQIVGQPLLRLVSPASHERLSHEIEVARTAGSVEATLLTGGGGSVPVRIGWSSLRSNGEHVSCITVTDLTTERRAEAELAHSAHHDALTGLPNRTLLTDRIQHALNRRTKEGTLIGLLFCDVDGFKKINDIYGHQAGDDLLRTVAERLTATVRPGDTVARIGGDEFVILCEELESIGDAAMVAARLRDAVALPIETSSAELEITISVGVAVAASEEAANPETLLRDSDEAMYKAKRQGPNFIEVFDDRLRVIATSRLRLLSEMRRADLEGELRLHYQPVLNLEQEQVVGVEALIRWQHPSRGLVPPDEFIPFAERSGLIVGMGAWVIRKACQQAALWTGVDQETGRLQMSVNVSGRQLARGAGLVETVRNALDESGVDPTMMTLEVTESALMDDAEAALRILSNLKSVGVNIAIDDFGTGYSSLLYLKRFPVDSIKVDRSFVAGLGRDRDDAAIVHSVIELAHAFGIAAVAEGIETFEQLAILQDLGCNYGQGYLWSRPLPPADLGPRLFDAGADAGRLARPGR